MRNFTCVVLGALALTAAPAWAQTGSSQLLGTFQTWSAYSNGSGAAKTCYALSQPQSSFPKKAKRDPIYFLISDWPGRRAKSEAEIVPGYKFKDDSIVTAQIGKDQKFVFFTKNDADNGTAWVQDVNDEARLVDAMMRGTNVVVSGTSQRGTETKDTYALAGLEQALERIHSTCGM